MNRCTPIFKIKNELRINFWFGLAINKHIQLRWREEILAIFIVSFNSKFPADFSRVWHPFIQSEICTYWIKSKVNRWENNQNIWFLCTTTNDEKNDIFCGVKRMHEKKKQNRKYFLENGCCHVWNFVSESKLVECYAMIFELPTENM